MNNIFNYYNLENYYKQKNIENSQIYIKWVKDIINTKISMFSYENLPDNLTSEIIEMALTFRNHLCFYNSNKFGFVLCYYVPNGEFDIYWKPTFVDLLALNGSNIETNVKYEDIVLVRDNTMDIIPFMTLNTHIDNIIELERTLNVLVKLVRFPKVFEGEKSEVAQLQQLIKKGIDFNPYVIADKNFTKGRLQDFDIDIPISPIDIYTLLEKYRNLALASIGIYGVDEKRERVVTSEVQAKNDYVDFIYTDMVEQRKLFIKLVNEKFGYKIKLKENYIKNKEDEIVIIGKETKVIENAKASANENDKGGEING